MESPFSESLGPLLKRERESRAVSLEELSKSTRISCPFLEALEKDDFNFFPQPEFIPGFLKGYARHLGLDGDEIIRRYRLQAEITSRQENFKQLALFPSSVSEDEASTLSPPGPVSDRQTKKKLRWNLLLQVFIILLAAGLAFYIHHFIKESKNLENPKGKNPKVQGALTGPLKKDNELSPPVPDKIEGAKAKGGAGENTRK